MGPSICLASPGATEFYRAFRYQPRIVGFAHRISAHTMNPSHQNAQSLPDRWTREAMSSLAINVELAPDHPHLSA